MDLGDSLRRGAKWVLVGNAGGRIVEFAFGVALARLLVPSDFGVLVTIQIYTGLAGFFAGAGIAQALVRAKHVEKDDYFVVFTVQLIIGSLIYLSFFFIAPAFSDWYENDLYRDLLRISALTFLLRPFSGPPRSRLHREMRFKELSIVRLVGLISSGFVSITLAIQGMGPWSLVIGGLTGAAVSAVVLMNLAEWRPRIRFDLEVARRLSGYGIKVSLNNILGYIRMQTGNFLISRHLGAYSLGIYNKADSLSRLPMDTLGNSAYQPVFRGMSKLQDNKDRSKYLYYQAINVVSVYVLPFYVGLFWVADSFIEVVYGYKWIEAAQPLKILALLGLFHCIENISGAIIAAQDRLGAELRIQVESWILLVIGGLIGVRWGINGIAWATVTASVYMTIRMNLLASRCISGTIYDLYLAIRPSVILNVILFASLFGANALMKYIGIELPIFYLMNMLLTGVVVYTLTFFLIPIPSLYGEVRRWKEAFKLVSSRQT